MNDFDTASSADYPDEINLRELIDALSASRNFIAISIALFTLVSVIYSLLAPQIWTSQALLTISKSDTGSMSSSAQGGLASLVSFGMNESNVEGSKATATIRSREFFNHIVEFDGVLANLMAAKSFDHKSNQTIFKSSVYDLKEQKWVNGKPSIWEAYKAYLGSLEVTLDSKSGFITIAINHRSPIFAESFLSLIIQEINSLSRQKDLA